MLATPIDPVLLVGENPFRDGIVREPWATPPDAERVNDAQGCALEDILRATAGDGRSRLCYLVGESGTGKSHLLGRMIRRAGAAAFPVFVDPYVRRDNACRHIRLRLVESLWGHGAEDGRRALERFMDETLVLSLEAFLDGDAGPLADAQRRFIDEVRSGALYRDPDRASLAPWFVARSLGAAALLAGDDAIRSLVAVRRPEQARAGLDWLRGETLDPADAEALGVGAADQTEDGSRDLVCALAALVRGAGPLLLLFDQTESLPLAGDGRPGLGHLLAILDGIRARAENVVIVVTCLGEVLRGVERPPDPDLSLELRGLDEGAARSLVAARIAPRLSRAPAPGYPFGDEFYARLDGHTAARDILSAAARELDLLRAAAAPPVDEAAHWRKVVAEHAAIGAGGPPPTDGILAWSVETWNRWRAKAGRAVAILDAPKGVDVAWRTGQGQRVGIAFSSSVDGRRFLFELRAATRVLEASELDRLLIVRRREVPDRWKSAARHLEAFGRAGGLVAGLDDESERTLRTVRSLRLAVDARDVRRPDGRIAERSEVGRAAIAHGALQPPPVVRIVENGHGA